MVILKVLILAEAVSYRILQCFLMVDHPPRFVYQYVGHMPFCASYLAFFRDVSRGLLFFDWAGGGGAAINVWHS